MIFPHIITSISIALTIITTQGRRIRHKLIIFSVFATDSENVINKSFSTFVFIHRESRFLNPAKWFHRLLFHSMRKKYLCWHSAYSYQRVYRVPLSRIDYLFFHRAHRWTKEYYWCHSHKEMFCRLCYQWPESHHIFLMPPLKIRILQALYFLSLKNGWIREMSLANQSRLREYPSWICQASTKAHVW